MTFHVYEVVSGTKVYDGIVTQRRMGVKARRRVVVCSPRCIEDVGMIGRMLSVSSGTNQLDNGARKPGSTAPAGIVDTIGRAHPATDGVQAHGVDTGVTDAMHVDVTQADMESYGHLTLSAISGYPLLIIGTTSRSYIHFSQIEAMLDETELGAPCTFSIVTGSNEYRFYVATSLEYLGWMDGFREAFEIVNRNGGGDGKMYSVVDDGMVARRLSRYDAVAMHGHDSARSPSTPRSLSRLARVSSVGSHGSIEEVDEGAQEDVTRLRSGRITRSPRDMRGRSMDVVRLMSTNTTTNVPVVSGSPYIQQDGWDASTRQNGIGIAELHRQQPYRRSMSHVSMGGLNGDKARGVAGQITPVSMVTVNEDQRADIVHNVHDDDDNESMPVAVIATTDGLRKPSLMKRIRMFFSRKSTRMSVSSSASRYGDDEGAMAYQQPLSSAPA